MNRSLAVILACFVDGLVLTTLACGSSSSSSSTGPSGTGLFDGGTSDCTAKISGAMTATMTCSMEASSGDTIKSFGLYGFDTSGHVLTGFIVVASDPEAKTYTVANVQSAAGMFYELPDGGGAHWTMSQGGDGGDVGTFSLDITDLGPSKPGTSGSNLNEIWAPHGTYTATYEAEPGGSATGTLTVDATF